MYKYCVCIIIFISLAVDDASDARVAMVRKMTRAGCARQRHEMPSLYIYGYLFSRVIRSFIIVDDELKKLKPCPKCRSIVRSAAPPPECIIRAILACVDKNKHAKTAYIVYRGLITGLVLCDPQKWMRKPAAAIYYIRYPPQISNKVRLVIRCLL